MGKKPTVFLESHNIKNQFFGFGQFNYHLLKALSKTDLKGVEIEIHVRAIDKWKQVFGDIFSYKKYHAFRRYKAFSIRKKYDLWHCLNQNIKIEPRFDLPYLLTVHNITYIEDKENYMQEDVHIRFQQKLSRSTAIVYISEYAKASTHQFFSVPDVPEYVIYNGNPITEVQIPKEHNPSFAPTNKFIFSIGEFTARKNFKSLISMLEFLPDYDLIIAGKNSTKEAENIKELVAQKKLSNRVVLPGKISELDKLWCYSNCEAFVFPSLREGFGLPIIEAMRFGKPVIASNNTSLPEIGSDIAYYWNHYNPAYMAKTVTDGIEDFSKNETQNVQRSISRAQSFTWENAAKQYVEVYKNILKI